MVKSLARDHTGAEGSNRASFWRPRSPRCAATEIALSHWLGEMAPRSLPPARWNSALFVSGVTSFWCLFSQTDGNVMLSAASLEDERDSSGLDLESQTPP